MIETQVIKVKTLIKVLYIAFAFDSLAVSVNESFFNHCGKGVICRTFLFIF